MNNSLQHNTDADLSTSSLLHELANHVDAMLAFWDKHQTCLYANDAYYTWFNKTKDQVIGSSLEALLGPLYSKNLSYIEAALASQISVFEREIPNPNGTSRHSLTTYTPFIRNDEVLGFFVHVADVTALKRLESELREAKQHAEELASHDFLTGLPNRVLLEERIKSAVSDTQKTQSFMAVMSLDIDNFKGVNDNYGHGIGDQLLIEVTQRITRALRSTDTITRMGGDEFLILTSSIHSVELLSMMAERILETINTPYRIGNHAIIPSCSLGIVYCTTGQIADSKLLISESDSALYQAKNQGKNQYVIRPFSAA